MTITEFLLARIAEDEAVAHEVEASNRADVERGLYSAELVAPETAMWATDGNFGQLAVYTHPSRVLAECNAKRLLIGLHSEDPGFGRRHPCIAEEADGWACLTLIALAGIYANHPDFREEWRDDTAA